MTHQPPAAQGRLAERLTECFREAFPGLSDDTIRSAIYEDLDEWDSLASLSLVAIVEDEFNVTLPDEVVADLTSYELILATLAELDGSQTDLRQ